MSARTTGRRIALASVAAVVGLAGALAWLGREHIRFALASEGLGRNSQRSDEFRARNPRSS